MPCKVWAEVYLLIFENEHMKYDYSKITRPKARSFISVTVTRIQLILISAILLSLSATVVCNEL